MRRRRVSFSSDPRWAALKRAGLAVTAALILLLAVLWFGDSGQPLSRPLSESAQAPPTQFNVSRDDAPASGVETTAPDEPAESSDLAAAETAATPEATESALQEAVASPEPLVEALDTSTPPPKAVAAPAKPISLPDGYFVQLGVFNDTDNADKVLENAVALGLPAHIQSRVVVGPFRNKREAEAARGRLKNIAEGVVLPPQKTAKADETPKAKSRRRAK